MSLGGMNGAENRYGVLLPGRIVRVGCLDGAKRGSLRTRRRRVAASICTYSYGE